MRDFARVSEADTKAMLAEMAKELKRTDYKLSRIVTSGTDHFMNLKVTTQAELKEFKEDNDAYKAKIGP